MKPTTKPTQRDEAFLQRGNGEPWALPTTRAKHNKGMKNKAKWRWCMAQSQCFKKAKKLIQICRHNIEVVRVRAALRAQKVRRIFA